MLLYTITTFSICKLNIYLSAHEFTTKTFVINILHEVEEVKNRNSSKLWKKK